MALYEEEEVYKCTQHSSKRRRCIGICPYCLTDRLSALCPDCANLRPCSCSSPSSSSSSVSSSFSISFSDTSHGRISSLIENEPPFLLRRSRSSVVVPEKPSSTSSLWSVFWWRNSKKENLSRSKSVGKYVRPLQAPAPATVKGKGWYFPSPMKVFRSSKVSKVAQERSPLQRG